MNEFQSTHKLDFECAKWPLSPEWIAYRVGTCHGLWKASGSNYDVLAMTNDSPGNGHFEDVMEWFEASCKRDGYALRILECWNSELKHHLMTKRGFENYDDDNLIKRFGNGKRNVL